MDVNKSAAMAAAFFLAGAATFTVQAADGEWSGEIAPFLWAVGIDGDVAVDGQPASMDVGFSDLLDETDLAGSLLAVLQYKQVVFSAQVDYLSLSNDDLDRSPAAGNLDSDSVIATLAVGYQFQGSKGRTYDLLVGARHLSLENTLTLNGIGTFEHDSDVTDAIVVLRPSIPLSRHWRFNPTLTYGGGDSDSTYELWPKFQYTVSDRWAMRLGYRRLYYDIEGDAGNSWDATFHGFTVGLGGTW